MLRVVVSCCVVLCVGVHVVSVVWSVVCVVVAVAVVEFGVRVCGVVKTHVRVVPVHTVTI